MHRLSGLLAVGFALAGVSSVVGCGSDATEQPSGSGGATGSGGAETGGVSVDGGDASGGSGGGKSFLCGNGAVDQGEDCDDQNEVRDDGCDNFCHWTCAFGPRGEAQCDNGYPCDGVETCGADHKCLPSTKSAPDGMICGETHTCKGGQCEEADAICGDRLTVPPEECDDRNDVAGDGCDSCRFSCLSTDPARNCVSADPCQGRGECNDNYHTCTPGTPLQDFSACGDRKVCINATCTDKYCSNGVVDDGEECDDGNRANGDGCDNSCKFSCDPADSTRDCHSENECILDGTCNVATHRCSAPAPKPAGTACGTDAKKNCIYGNCIAPLCGDGVLAVGNESCDDGDARDGNGCDNDCTRSCVNPTTDCPASPSCRGASCEANVCSTMADPSKDGQSCNTGGGDTTCHEGACTSVKCGNGTVDAGEQCDDGNTTPRDGCEPNCTNSCSDDASCDDGDPCNGAETCIAASPASHGKLCKAGTAKDPGTACGSGRVCVSGSCRPSFCGDGVVSGAEQCDPPNTTGCKEDCSAREQCDLSGAWAMKLVVPVSWGDDVSLFKGTGQILQWALMNVTQPAGATSFTGKIKACALTIPDFHTTDTLGNEWYGITFANSGFDSPSNRVFDLQGSVGSRLIGAQVTMDSVAIQLGLTIGTPASPFGPWPAAADFTPAKGYTYTDTDGDTRQGHSAGAKTGTVPGVAGESYQNPIIAIDFGSGTIKRADLLELAIRQIARNSGNVDTCTALSGATQATIDNHIVGCRAEGGAACGASEYGLIDNVRPAYVVTNATFTATKLVNGNDCAAVRAAIK